ncbi:type I-F CRISPR-associated protein Csy1 [Salinibius halmophilus]|uniref:type I-F CRISPR-associated protein Csy1 n=1 Tax=Salinibius halmophilus TaxID=1853216 RepID=UPI000E670692|nr:type I-F CRISPR-associated protein Csy1 [Salinibius halmophilus]
MTDTLEQAIADYIKGRKLAKLEPLEKARDKALKEAATSEQIEAAEQAFAEGAQALEEQFKPESWLTDAAKRAKQIAMATHAAKFAHSDAKASSFLDDEVDTHESRYLTTASLPVRKIDAVGNAAALDVARLLKLEADGESLVNQLNQGHINALDTFTDNADLRREWFDGFKQAVTVKDPTAHTLLKQVYFPVAEGSYHLLCPLGASSLMGVHNAAIETTRYGDSKEVRDARRNEHYHERTDVRFPHVAVQNFGGSKPQNISQLNNERGGKVYLLNSQPPTFEAVAKPPENETQLLRRFDQATWWHVTEFKSFLVNLTDRDSNFKTRYKRDYQYLIPICERVLQQAALLQASFEPGWSTSTSLPAPLQAWLDPHAHETQRQNKDWLLIVSQWLTDWLVRRLQNDKSYKLADVEHRYINKVIKHELTMVELGRTEQGGQ